ncbi:MAG: Gfo/Idh/MocA family oxidoreductase [Clostridiales Family XIII bacterium]|jgi:predicted dehydrogenase|nr:Gfo/Idh/MocA family oxidoreductase [Clostridiales Family XIII bacterium]
MAIKWGFIGAGRITRRFLEGLIQVDDAIPYAVYGRTLSKAEALAKDYGFEYAFGTVEELLASGIDVAYVATTHPSHAEFAKKVIDAGIPVLCEKPLSPNAKISEDLIDYAREKDVFLMEAMWTRTFPASHVLREWLSDEKIGKIIGVTGSFSFHAPLDFDDRLMSIDHAGGAILDIGVYLLAFVNDIIAGRPDEVKAVGAIATNGADTGASVSLRYGDKLVSLFMTIQSDSPDTITIYGDKGRIDVHADFWRPRKITLTTESEILEFETPETSGDPTFQDSFLGEGYQHEVQHVQDCISKGLKESPLMPLDSTLIVAEISDAIRKQIGVIYPFEK